MQKALLLCCLLCLFLNVDAGCPGGDCEAPWWAEGRDRESNESEERSRRQSNVTLRVAPGSRVYMKCRAQGSPTPSLQWFKDGAPLAQKRHHIVFRKRALKLNRVKGKDSGNYSCRASNQHGAITKHFFLSVLGPSSREKLVVLQGFPRNVTAFVGQPAVLTCRVLTNVPYTARWLRYVDDIATLIETDDNVRQVRDSLEDFSDESSIEDSSSEEEEEEEEEEDVEWENDLEKHPRSEGKHPRSSEEDSGVAIQQRLWRRRHFLSMEFDQSSSSSSQEDENDLRLVIRDAKLNDSGRYSCLVMSKRARIEKAAWLTVHPVGDEVELAYAERRQLWQKRWGSDQGPEEYLRGIVIAVSVSSVLLVVSLVVLFVMAVMKAYNRQDVVLRIYDLREQQEA